jgi:hypothetical protein
MSRSSVTKAVNKLNPTISRASRCWRKDMLYEASEVFKLNRVDPKPEIVKAMDERLQETKRPALMTWLAAK